MNRETLLDEAIAKAKEAEDWQLVEWLRMARGGESAARWYTKKLREAEAENERLKERVEDALIREEQRICEMEAENAKLRELVLDMFLYLQDGFIISDEMVNEFAEKLRELGVEVEL